MTIEAMLKYSILENYTPMDSKKLDEELLTYVKRNQRKIVVLDDDPTGVQTVHDVSVYTDWTEDSIRKGFEEDNKLFYILTNSRGFTTRQTIKCHQEIISCVEKMAKETGKEYLIMSRSDSTLRGHYPLETELLKEGFEADGKKKADGEILCPFFKEGGRFTINNVHYVKTGDELVPAGQTEFAKDKTFGYTHSNLCKYVEEKTKGKYKAEDVTCISLEDLRQLRIEKIADQLMAVSGFGKVIVNAVDYCDLKVFAVALYHAMDAGKNFIFRAAAALVKVMGAITDRPLLTRKDMMVKETENGGIIVVGSHTEKTTSQLEALKRVEGLEFIEFKSELVLDEVAFDKEIEAVLKKEEALIRTGKTVVVYTRRKLLSVENDTKEEALKRSVKISDAVQSLVGRLSVTPAFVIAKGGITSSDIGTKALRVKRANVMGQIRPGIPVWQTGEESKFPLTPYVIFPGNVGEIETLKEAVEVMVKK